MISPTSVTNQYALQPGLIEKHKKTVEWLSASALWKRELSFFQTLLDNYAPGFTTLEDKKKLDHFQNIIIYYKGELVDMLASKLRQHEKTLAEMLETRDERLISYFKEHYGLMGEMEAFREQFVQHKEDLFNFIERAMRAK